MKNILKTMVAAALIAMPAIASAQQMPEIPKDPEVRVGKLDNGMTYYIRHNDFVKNRAEFRIAQKVGSILEEDNQRGLAHFLEHMCFNGTKHFPGDMLKKYLESIGVKFGLNLNAYTSIDETVYRVSDAPVEREGVIDSCLLILHDWADDLLLEDEEIDKERGVIHEEWRQGMGATMRMYEKTFPEMFQNSKYAYRLPIGTMEVVDNFPYQALRDYYEKWYRPDQQGIIVVGDIDVDKVEQKIKDLFSPIKMPENVAERTYAEVPNNKEPIFTLATDKEQTSVMVYVYHKHDAVPQEAKNTQDYLIYDYAISMIEYMMNQRFTEITLQPESPFVASGVYDGDFILAKTKQALTTVAISKEDKIDESLATLLRETDRVQKFGFTASEYVRAQQAYLSGMESLFNERDKQTNATFAEIYVRNFIDNDPMPSIEQEYQLMSQYAKMIPVEAINQLIPTLLTDSNVVVSIMGPDKAGLTYPTKEEMRKVYDAVEKEELTPYVDNTTNEPLIKDVDAIKPGTVAKKEAGAFGSTVYTLSNGARVIIKKTDLKDNEILMRAYSQGGQSLLDVKDFMNYSSMIDLIELGGLGNFSVMDLQKALAGKQVSIMPFIGQGTEGFSGHSTPKDFETLLQLNYLYFTAPRKDVEAVKAGLERMKASLKNADADPSSAFSDTLMKVMYNNPRAQRIKADMIDQIDYDRTMELYKQRFNNIGDFTYIFVGNIDEATALPLIEKYIGSLPSSDTKEKYNVKNMYSIQDGVVKSRFTKQMESKKATVLQVYSTENVKYTPKDNMIADLIGQLLDYRYTEEIRENSGAAYSVGVYGGISAMPEPEAMLQIYFDTDPERIDEVMSIVNDEINKLVKDGPIEADIEKAKEYMEKQYGEDIKNNSHWLMALYDEDFWGYDGDTNYIETLRSIKASEIQKLAKKLLSGKDMKEVIMVGEEAAK